MALGAPLLLSDIIGMVTLRLDTVMLSIMSSPAEVGYYSVANKLREIDGRLIPVNRQIGFRQPSAVRALFGMIQAGAQAAEIDRAFQQYGRAIGKQAAILAVGGVIPELLYPFDD